MNVQVTFHADENILIELVAGRLAEGYAKRIEIRTVKRWLRDAFSGYGYQWDFADDLGLPDPSDEDYDRAVRKLQRIGLLKKEMEESK